MIESVEKSKAKNLAILAGFCWRYDKQKREFFKRIHDGAIGDVRAVYGTYITGPVKPMKPASARQEGTTDLEWMVRNWYNFTWLSGDSLAEQAVHSVDKINWADVRLALDETGFTGWSTAEVPGGNRDRIREVGERMDKYLLGV